MTETSILNSADWILVTGANGFIGARTVERLLERGFTNIRCFVQTTGNLESLMEILEKHKNINVEILKGNLLNKSDCEKATDKVSLVIHLAAGIDKSFAAAFLNSVVTTRNLLEAIKEHGVLKRFVNVSSLAVYSNLKLRRRSVLDETCEVEKKIEIRQEAYPYGKFKQDEFVEEFCGSNDIPYVIVRPSVVYGPGKRFIPSRIGIEPFGFFINIGGSIQQPLTYVDNCADALVLAGIVPGVEKEVFNVIDDNLPTGRQFLKIYKKKVRKFFSLYMPYRLFYILCFIWEKYSNWSKGQLPPAFNRPWCATYYKGNVYPNRKLKEKLGWEPIVPFNEAMERYTEFQKIQEVEK